METPNQNDKKMPSAQNANLLSEKRQGKPTLADNHTETTGVGFTQEERIARRAPDNGSQYLVDKYNINDQAHSDSDLNDFVKTVSNFRHEDEK